MAHSESPLIAPTDIALGTSTVIIDARSGPDAYDRYMKGHLPGALHVDLDRDLSQKPKDPAFGGRHPLPDVKVFAEFLGKLGISPTSAVVVYDDKNGANAAARLWWMLRALGHANVKVVDGGLDSIIRDRLPLETTARPVVSLNPYPAKAWLLPTVSMEDVEAAASDPDALVIDVREAYRYRGEREPIDLVAGHIPGAINVPYLNNLAVNGSFLPAEKLAEQFNDILDHRNPSNVIVHCGSGVTACHTLLALEQAGIYGASLYVGSWGEWSRREMPIGTGEK